MSERKKYSNRSDRSCKQTYSQSCMNGGAQLIFHVWNALEYRIYSVWPKAQINEFCSRNKKKLFIFYVEIIKMKCSPNLSFSIILLMVHQIIIYFFFAGELHLSVFNIDSQHLCILNISFKKSSMFLLAPNWQTN